MSGIANYGWLSAAGAVVLSVTLVMAFSVGDTGARDVSASVVADDSAFVALEANANNAYKGFVSTDSDGQVQVDFDGTNADASGQGVNPNSTYEFNSIINVTNQATESQTLDVAISGTDAASCEVAWTSTESQQTGDYSADPTAISLSKDATAFLGLKIDASSKGSGDTIACQITVQQS